MNPLHFLVRLAAETLGAASELLVAVDAALTERLRPVEAEWADRLADAEAEMDVHEPADTGHPDGEGALHTCGCQTYWRKGKELYGYMCDEHIYRCKKCQRPTFPIMQYDTACCSQCTPPDNRFYRQAEALGTEDLLTDPEIGDSLKDLEIQAALRKLCKYRAALEAAEALLDAHGIALPE